MRFDRISRPDSRSVNLAMREPRPSIPPQKASLLASSASRPSPMRLSTSLQKVVARTMFLRASGPQSSLNIFKLRSADPSTLAWLILWRYRMPASL
jgi:hypothetical protein